MSNHRPELYRWKRKTDPKMVYSRSQKVTSTNDVQDWIKKVEEASNIAAAQTFGTEYMSGRSKAKHTVKNTVDYLHEDDATYSEAQDLLNQWMSDKVNFDAEPDMFDDDWTPKPSPSQIKKEWDHLLEDQGIEYSQSPKTSARELYSGLENCDEDELVSKILDGMRDKELIKDEFLTDLGLDESSKHRDPRTKMELRHQQVKENREKRQKDLEKQRREKQSRKDAQSRAKQMLLKEEKQKQMQARREEMQLQKEMAKIRKEMQEERRREEEMKAREKEEREELQRKAQEELDRQQLAEEMQKRQHLQVIEDKRKDLMRKLEQVEKRQAANNLKILQRHFSAWYNIVLERRIQIGKARAMADWKCLLRAWNAWKAYCRSKRIEREAMEHEWSMKEYHRKTQLAQTHYRDSLLRRYFSAWQLFVQQEHLQNESKEQQSRLHDRMSALLNAAATGKLWNKNENDKNIQKPSREEMKVDSVRDKVDELFAQPSRPRDTPMSSRSDDSSIASSRDVKKAWQPPPLTKPTEPWQVTRRHLNLTKEQIAGGGDHGNTDNGENDQSGQIRQSKKLVTQKTPFMVNNFENRHNAQQEILRKQQEQIREQQKMIQELQYQQQMSVLQAQAQTQQLIQKHLSNNSVNVLAQQGDLLNVQHNVVAKDVNVNPDSARSQKSGASTARSAVSARSASSDTTAASSASKKSATKHDEILKKMEDRAAERARMKAEREERKRKQEEEKLAQLQAEEEERLRQEEEEKKARIEARKEQKRKERQKELEKQQKLEYLHEMNVKAEEHCRKTLLRHKGFLPWMKLVQQARRNNEVAQDHHASVLLRNCLLAWHNHTQDVMAEKKDLAQELFNFIIVRRCFRNWRRYGQHVNIQEQKADRFYLEKLKGSFFRAWADYTAYEKIADWKRERMAREHDVWRLKHRAFIAWKRFPAILKDEREKERRRQELRKKVSAILPDFEGLSLSKSRDSFD